MIGKNLYLALKIEISYINKRSFENNSKAANSFDVHADLEKGYTSLSTLQSFRFIAGRSILMTVLYSSSFACRRFSFSTVTEKYFISSRQLGTEPATSNFNRCILRTKKTTNFDNLSICNKYRCWLDRCFLPFSTPRQGS